jgi:hypothetical protein
MTLGGTLIQLYFRPWQAWPELAAFGVLVVAALVALVSS